MFDGKPEQNQIHRFLRHVIEFHQIRFHNVSQFFQVRNFQVVFGVGFGVSEVAVHQFPHITLLKLKIFSNEKCHRNTKCSNTNLLAGFDKSGEQFIGWNNESKSFQEGTIYQRNNQWNVPVVCSSFSATKQIVLNNHSLSVASTKRSPYTRHISWAHNLRMASIPSVASGTDNSTPCITLEKSLKLKR